MAKDVSPQEETTGKLTATYSVLVSVEGDGQILQVKEGVESALQRAVAESYPGEAGCAVVQRISHLPAPEGAEDWTVLLTALIDLTVWRRELGPHVDGGYAAMTVRDLLADADMTAIDARITTVVPRMLVHAPA